MGIHYPLYAMILDSVLVSITLILLYLFFWKLDIPKLQSRGKAALERGNLAGVIANFGRIVAAKDPPGKQPAPELRELLCEAYHHMGDAYAVQEGKAAEAARCYARIRELGGGLSKAAILVLARFYASGSSRAKPVVEVFLAVLQLQLIGTNDEEPVIQALREALMIDEQSAEPEIEGRIRFAQRAMQWAPRLAWLPFYVGVGLYRLGQNEEAAAQLRAAARLDPAEGMIFYWLGLVIHRLAPDSAEEYEAIETFLARESADTNVQARKATTAFDYAQRLIEPLLEGGWERALQPGDKEKIDKAQSLLTKVVALSAYNDHAHCYLGECARLLGDYRGAVPLFAKAVEIAPEKVPYGLALAQTWLALKDLEQAKRCIEKILAVNPQHMEALHLVIEIASRENDFSALEEYCHRALESGDAAVLTHARYIIALYNLEKHSQICQLYADATRISLEEAAGIEAIFCLARAHALNGELHTALDLYERAPVSPRNDYYRAGVFAHLGRSDEAIALWEKVARETSAFQIKALLQCGYLMEKQGSSRAESYYLKALKLDRRHEEALSALGLFYLRSGNLEKAATQGLKLRKEFPANPHGLWIMGQVHESKKENAEAIQAYEPLRDQDLYKGAVQRHIGILYYHTGRYAEAMAVLEGVQKSGDADPSMLFFLGLCFARLDRYADAINLWRTLLEQKPQDAKVKANLAHVYYRYAEQLTRERKLVEAVFQLENFITLDPGNEKARLHLAQLYFQLGIEEIMKGAQSSDDRVNEYMGKSFQYRPDHQLSAFYLALSDLYRQNHADALLKLAELAAKNPQDRRIQYYYGLAQLLAGDQSAGDRLFNKLLKQNSSDLYGQNIMLFLANRRIRGGEYQQAVTLLEKML